MKLPAHAVQMQASSEGFLAARAYCARALVRDLESGRTRWLHPALRPDTAFKVTLLHTPRVAAPSLT
eukprot:scaffold7752_cov31-Phaeocystis_antarctica.AAC.2